MQDYINVSWNSEPLSLEKIQNMIQNDQSVADEIDLKPFGIIGYSELTMYASNTGTNSYADWPPPFQSSFPNSPNTTTKIKEWTRVVDNWNINPNGLSASVNVGSNRLIHVELYIPLLAHANPDVTNTAASGNPSTAAWPIQGFKFVRDGVDISGESMVDTWTSRSSSSVLSTHSFYFDCWDFSSSAGSHLYEVMWKSEQGLKLEIWQQMRNSFAALPLATREPDQQTYLGSAAAAEVSASGRYNISDFDLPVALAQKYSSTDLLNGNTYSTGDASYTPAQMWDTSNKNAPFAGSIPTAQLIITDCGSSRSVLFYKDDGQVIQDDINASQAQSGQGLSSGN